jgi:hypothetical protein
VINKCCIKKKQTNIKRGGYRDRGESERQEDEWGRTRGENVKYVEYEKNRTQ